jgi:hypothetical protein
MWLPGPTREIHFDNEKMKRGRYAILAFILFVVLFLSRTLFGPNLLYAWPIISAGTIIYLKPKFSKKELTYAAILALVGGIAGLGAKWVPFHPVVWSVLQVFLVTTGLLAGWALLRYAGLWQLGISRSQYLDNGLKSAIQSFSTGIIISIPWALGFVLMGSAASQMWVQKWWQPLIAISPGIGEEVWGKVFPIPLIFILLRRVFQPKRAYIISLVIISFWFAYLHTAGGIEGVISTAMIGTLIVLPLTYICFHRDLETAFGFHFFVDFVKFVVAYNLNIGNW